MASSRRLPTSYNESTYDSHGSVPATCDYTSLATWEAATDNDLVTATDGEVLTCEAGVHDDTVDVTGATTSSSYFRVIRAADGARGTPTSGVRFVVTSTVGISYVLRFPVVESYSSVYDIAISVNTTTTDVNMVAFNIQNTGSFVSGCTVYDSATTDGTGYVLGFYVLGTTTIMNCFVDSVTGDGSALTAGFFLASAATNPTIELYNCTVTNSDTGIIVYAPAGQTAIANVKNCIIQDNATATALYGAGGTETLNETTNVTSGVTFAADGYHLSSADCGANGGTDLSATFTDDIDGDTRPTGSLSWDIGCDEYISGVNVIGPFPTYFKI